MAKRRTLRFLTLLKFDLLFSRLYEVGKQRRELREQKSGAEAEHDDQSKPWLFTMRRELQNSFLDPEYMSQMSP